MAADCCEGFTLPGGVEVNVRLVEPADAATIECLYGTLSRDDTYRRFFSAFRPDRTWFARWAAVNERGGVGLIAEARPRGGEWSAVADAVASPMTTGNYDLALTIAPTWRGFMGPYLLDALCRVARDRGMTTLNADVLVTNRAMLALVRRRPYAIVAHDGSVVRFVVSTDDDAPGFAPSDARPRVLVETPSGWWGVRDALERRGMQVLACPGPQALRRGCPLLQRGGCRLTEEADVIVFALRDATPDEGSVFERHAAERPLRLAVPRTSKRAPCAPAVIDGNDEAAIVDAVADLYVERRLEAACA